MKNTLKISLRANEKIYLNGAVVRADRKVSIELLNDVQFLLESHVLQPQDASTPLRQLRGLQELVELGVGLDRLLHLRNGGELGHVLRGVHRLRRILVLQLGNQQLEEGFIVDIGLGAAGRRVGLGRAAHSGNAHVYSPATRASGWTTGSRTLCSAQRMSASIG